MTNDEDPGKAARVRTRGPAEAHPEDAALFDAVWRVAGALRDAIEPKLHSFGLTAGEIGLLFVVSRGKRATFGELARRFGVKGPRITEMVNGLEADGFVVRQRTSDDRRVVYVSTTSKGRKVSRRVEGMCAAEIARASARMSASSKREMAARLGELATALAESPRR